jgi:hypothetical protein
MLESSLTDDSMATQQWGSWVEVGIKTESARRKHRGDIHRQEIKCYKHFRRNTMRKRILKVLAHHSDRQLRELSAGLAKSAESQSSRRLE